MFLAVWVALSVNVLSGAEAVRPPAKQGAALLKSDILCVFAHPDDETGMAGTLALYAIGKGAVVANVYCTRGEGGGNMVGTQAGAALGVLREAELRECLAKLGVRYCYFLDQLDWAYTESAAATLRKWGKEDTLGKLVRLVRSLRPEIILTMNPAPVPGQHGHHQAAGLLATEAFDAAADPERFPDQLAGEGLSVWQPRKLYWSGGRGGGMTSIDLTEALPDGRTPGQIAAEALSNHRSQAFGNFGNSPWLSRPQIFTLVKSVVPFTGIEPDFFRGLPVRESVPKPTPLSPRSFTNGARVLTFLPRPAVRRYLRWIQEQGIEQVAWRFDPDVALVAGEANEVRVELRSTDGGDLGGGLRLIVPEEWKVQPESRQVRVRANDRPMTYEFRVTPATGANGDISLAAEFMANDTVARATAVGHLLPKTRVMRVSSVPPLGGRGDGWDLPEALIISSTNLVQGKVTGDTDSSARFRLVHDGQTLFVEVEVTDDVVVSNIAPDDIKGHWRSDSVEICLDPVGGAEDTMGCFKLGVFPFDTTGVVRAARDADANQGPVEETAPGTRIASQRTPGGYRLQASIPFREIGVTPAPGKRLGFNLIIYDGDKANAAPGENINKSRIAWAPRSGVQGRPEDWGRIDLE